MKDIIAGYATQIRKLKKRIESLDMDNVDPVELKSALDSLKDLESRLADAKKAKEERRKAREDKKKEMEKQSEEPMPQDAPKEEVPLDLKKPLFFRHPKRPTPKPHKVVDVPAPKELEGTEVELKETPDIVPGGKADKKEDKDFDKKQLADGLKVELEHTNNIDLAKEIAKDHLTEDPDYYKKLKTIHKEDSQKEADVSKLTVGMSVKHLLTGKEGKILEI